MKRTLSVLITYYNEKHLLGECLASLFAQTEYPDEVLIYDDASTYPARDYVPSAFPVNVIRGETNKGPAYARNMLLQASSCDYVHFHDTDDLFHSDWCQHVRHAFNTTDVDAVFTEISSYHDGKLLCPHVLGISRLEQDPDLLRFCLRGVMLVPAGTYRKAVVSNIGGYRTQLWQSEDFDFHVRLAASYIKFTVIYEPLIFIRVRSESRSQNHRETRLYMLEAVQLLATEIPKEYHNELAEVAAYVGSNLFKLGDLNGARKSFQIAYSLGSPTFINQRRFYRIIARRWGPEVAEQITALYRLLLPEQVRRLFVKTGW